MLKNETLPSAAPDALLTSTEVGHLLKWHPESVRRAVRDGRLPAVYLGRWVRIRDSVARKILTDGLRPLA